VNSASNPNEPWDVFLPLKQFDAGKSRLGNIPADFRVSLIKAMAVDLIDVLLQTPQIASITIVGVNHQDLINSANPRLRSFPISQPIDINWLRYWK
jgi:2-phospho-L-lactate guanylyltransferase (CobY/MobA/RfbA family)